MELDHIFIRAVKDAPEAELLIDFGLVEASANVHLGQGTACRRFFFQNMMLELLWIEDEKEIESDLTKLTRLFERLYSSAENVSPFGVCFRPKEKTTNKALFSSWKYKPSFLPNELFMEFSIDKKLNEPLWFHIPFAIRQSLYPVEKIQSMEHKIDMQEVTFTRITVLKENGLSKTAEIINNESKIQIVEGSYNLLEIEFDMCAKGKTHDFRPSLPLVLRW